MAFFNDLYNSAVSAVKWTGSIFKRSVRFVKRKFSQTAFASIVAVIISVITMYFQFFNVNHELLYAYLFPSVPDKLVIPMVYKNDGNQNEMILESNIELEIIPDDGTPNYFKRIGDDNKKLFPLIIAPGEYKTISLLGDYKEYFKGMLEYTDKGIKFRRIVNFDTLSVVLIGIGRGITGSRYRFTDHSKYLRR